MALCIWLYQLVKSEHAGQRKKKSVMNIYTLSTFTKLLGNYAIKQTLLMKIKLSS